jgi:regulator of sirC expression with transglutaminase-like and TPR domain
MLILNFFVFSRPGEIKWHLMVASCHRRSGDYAAALEKYKWIHQHFPDDTDCKILRQHTHQLLTSSFRYSISG